MTKKVLLLNDTTNWYHFGCTATSTALKEQIQKLGYTLTTYSITETYKIVSVPDKSELFEQQTFFEKFKEENPILTRLLEENDVIVINGEGTLHGVRQAPLSLLYVAYAAKKFLGKHVEIINHSPYPQDSMELDEQSPIFSIYKLVYEAIDFAAVREPKSYSLMARMGVKAQQTFDCMPLCIKDHYQFHGEKEDKTLLVAGSAAWLHLNILSSEAGNIGEFEKGLSGFIAYLEQMSARGYVIKFLYGAPEYPAKDDREFIAFIEKLKASREQTWQWEIVTATSLTDWLGHIERASLLVSGRFHHSIAAACVGTRFILLNSNTPKIEGLAEILGCSVIQYMDPQIVERLLEASTSVELLDKETVLTTLCQSASENFQHLDVLMQSILAESISQHEEVASTEEDSSSEVFTNNIVVARMEISYDNYILNHPLVQEIMKEAFSIGGRRLVDSLIEKGQDQAVLGQLSSISEIGITQTLCKILNLNLKKLTIKTVDGEFKDLTVYISNVNDEIVALKMQSEESTESEPTSIKSLYNDFTSFISNLHLSLGDLHSLYIQSVNLIESLLDDTSPETQSDGNVAFLSFLFDLVEFAGSGLPIALPARNPHPSPDDFGDIGGDVGGNAVGAPTFGIIASGSNVTNSNDTGLDY